MRTLKQFGDYSIVQVYQDAAFWSVMGPFFTSRQVVKELEGPMYNDDNYTWIIAYDKSIEIAGFTSLNAARMGNGIIECTAAYVVAAHRRKGLYRELFRQREMLGFALGATELRGVANATSRNVFVSEGWEVVRMAGKWTHFKKVKA
jgi:GNAT superfamily N-acetyltransferase